MIESSKFKGQAVIAGGWLQGHCRARVSIITDGGGDWRHEMKAKQSCGHLLD